MKSYVLHDIGSRGPGYVVHVSEPGDKPRGVRELFDQGEWWQQKSGEWIRIVNMAPSHRGNTARMLMRRARNRAFAYSLGVLGEVGLMQSGPLAVGGDVSLDAIDRMLDDTECETSEDPHGWLARTALFRALVDGLTGDDARGLDPARYGRPICQVPDCGCPGEAHP